MYFYARFFLNGTLPSFKRNCDAGAVHVLAATEIEMARYRGFRITINGGTEGPCIFD